MIYEYGLASGICSILIFITSLAISLLIQGAIEDLNINIWNIINIFALTFQLFYPFREVDFYRKNKMVGYIEFILRFEILTFNEFLKEWNLIEYEIIKEKEIFVEFMQDRDELGSIRRIILRRKLKSYYKDLREKQKETSKT